jgi:hypothetical protein
MFGFFQVLPDSLVTKNIIDCVIMGQFFRIFISQLFSHIFDALFLVKFICHFAHFFPRYHKKFPPNANIIGFLHTHIITYLAKFGWNYLEEYLLFRADTEERAYGSCCLIHVFCLWIFFSFYLFTCGSF